MDITILGQQLLGYIPLGDIVLYLAPLNLFMFKYIGLYHYHRHNKTETQVEAGFGTLKDRSESR